MVYWQTNPRNTCFGFRKTRSKSATVSVMPMKSIVSASENVTSSPLSHDMAIGLKNPSTAAERTQNGKRLVSVVTAFTKAVSLGANSPPPDIWR